MTTDQFPTARVDAALFRHVLSHFCSGVVAVAAADGSTPVGFTCQSFTALSLDPPLVLFGVARTSTSWPRVRAAGTFVVNILAAEQEAVSRALAVSGADKFARVGWSPGPTGAPRIAGALAYVECELHAVHDGGDHEIVVGRVLDITAVPAPGDPLVYFRSGYRRLR